MTTNCVYCGKPLTAGKLFCQHCGRRLPAEAGPPGVSAPRQGPEAPGGPAGEPGGKEAQAGSPSSPSSASHPSQSPAPGRRDKRKDFALLGKVVADKYRILDVLGQGGFGTVFLVEITAGIIGEKLALKILPEELGSQATFRNQFLNEIRVAMRLVDKNIVQIRDVGLTDDGLLYYTMDFCPGITLAQLLRREGKLAITRALLLVLNVLRALQTAHAAGIIHRDLKPANIMVQDEGGKESVRVLDFGIAMAIEAKGDKPKGFAGSPHYMPPEQFLGEEIGFYTDLYSVGVILYECITGQRPYPGGTAQEVFRSLKSRTPPPAEECSPEVKAFPGLSQLVAKAMERNPERRFQSAKEFFDEVNAILVRGTTIEAPQPPAPPPRGYPALRAAGAPPAAPRPPLVPPDAARAVAERIRRRRSPIAARRSEPRVIAVAMATLILALVAVGVLFHKEILRFWESQQAKTVDLPPPPEKPETPSRDQPPEPKGKEEPPKSKEDLARAKEAAQAELFKRYFTEAQKALEAKDFKGALAAALQVLSRDGENQQAHEIRGKAAFELKDYNSAEESLEKVRANLGPDKMDLPSLLSLCETKLRLAPPKLDEAEVLAAAARAKASADPAVILLSARIYEEAGKINELKALLADAKERKVTSAELSRLWEEHVGKDLIERRKEGLALLESARESLKKGDFVEANRLALESAKWLPTAEADVIVAACQMELGPVEKARKIAEESLARWKPAGEEEEPEGFTAELEAELRCILDCLSGKQALARYLSAEGEPGALLKEAFQSFDRARIAASKLPSGRGARTSLHAALGLGQLHALEGNVDAVARVLGPLEDAQDPRILVEVATVFFDAGRKTSVREQRIKAYDLSRKLCNLALKHKTLPAATKMETHFRLGLCNLRIGDLANREKDYRQALDDFSDAEAAGLKSPELYSSWGAAYDRVGNLIRAAQCFRTVYDLDPTPENCLRAVDAFLKANPLSPEAKEILRDGKDRFKDNEEIQNK